MTQLSRTAQAKLAAEIAATAPAKEWDSVPELKKWREQIMLKNGERKSMSFDDLVLKYKDIDAEIKYREGILGEIKTSLTAAMLVSGETEVMCENYPVQYVTRKGRARSCPRSCWNWAWQRIRLPRPRQSAMNRTSSRLASPRRTRHSHGAHVVVRVATLDNELTAGRAVPVIVIRSYRGMRSSP